MATSVYSYFNGGGVKQIANSHSGLASGTTAPTSLGTSISSYSWTYDTAGRAASFTAPEGSFESRTATVRERPCTASNASRSLTVTVRIEDNTNQLTSSSFTPLVVPPSGGPATESFNFDSTGNRNSQTVAGTTTTTTVNHNRLLSDGTYNYTYDGEGNRATRTEIATGKVVNYTWDHRDRLTVVEFRNSAGGTLTKKVINSYDAFDRRVMKQVDDNGDGTLDRTERYVWDGDEISLVLDGSTSAGTVLHRFLHGPAIDQIFADESSVDGLLWDLGDNQNTTRDVVNNTGTVVNHVTYSAFGVIASESNTAKTPFFAYTGRDWDEDLQLQYNRARWYEPGTGRWLNEDPDRFGAGDVNLQRYVVNDPTNGTDPSGLDKIDIRDDRGGGTLFIYSDYSFWTAPRTAGELLAKVPYRCSERDIALENARKVLADEKLRGLRGALRNGINAADLAARIAAEGVDTVNDIVEFAQQPSTAGAAAIALPAFAGKIAKTCLKNVPKGAASTLDTIPEGRRLAPFYPPNRGFLHDPIVETLQPGIRIDRYGLDGGTFAAPAGTPAQMRSLAPGSLQKPYNVYEILKPFDVRSGSAAPWFQQPGLGTQYELPLSISDLIEQGFIRKVN